MKARTYRVRYIDQRRQLQGSRIVVAFDEDHARELFWLVDPAGRDRNWATLGHVELLSRSLPRFSDAGPFLRLDHRPMNFPMPGLWLPLKDCGGSKGAEEMGFEHFGRREPAEALPQASGLVAVFPSQREITIWTRDPAQPMRSLPEPTLEIIFPDPHPQSWLTAAWEVGSIALLAHSIGLGRYDTLGAALVAAWVLVVPIGQGGHGVPVPATAGRGGRA